MRTQSLAYWTWWLHWDLVFNNDCCLHDIEEQWSFDHQWSSKNSRIFAAKEKGQNIWHWIANNQKIKTIIAVGPYHPALDAYRMLKVACMAGLTCRDWAAVQGDSKVLMKLEDFSACLGPRDRQLDDAGLCDGSMRSYTACILIEHYLVECWCMAPRPAPNPELLCSSVGVPWWSLTLLYEALNGLVG